MISIANVAIAKLNTKTMNKSSLRLCLNAKFVGMSTTSLRTVAERAALRVTQTDERCEQTLLAVSHPFGCDDAFCGGEGY
jgi:hypothetical protein